MAEVAESRFPVPAFCRLEHLTPSGWETRHEGINLLHPERFVERLAAKGKIGRVTIVDTGEVIQLDEDEAAALAARQTCGFCGEVHNLPYDGSCLL